MKKPAIDRKTKHRIELMLIILIITLIGNVILFFVNTGYEEDTLSVLENPPISVEMNVVFGAGDSDTVALELAKNTTALEALRSIYPIEQSDGSVTKVYNTADTWTAYVNGDAASPDTQLEDGDLLLWTVQLPEVEPSVTATPSAGLEATLIPTEPTVIPIVPLTQ